MDMESMKEINVMWFMIPTTTYESKPKATILKIHVRKKHLLPNSIVAFVDVLQNIQKWVSSIW